MLYFSHPTFGILLEIGKGAQHDAVVADPRDQLHLVVRMNVNLFYLTIPEIILLQK